MSATAHAKVSVMIEVSIDGGAWGKDCTVSQVHKQAMDSVRNRLSRLHAENRDITIIGDLKVHMITFPLEDRPRA